MTIESALKTKYRTLFGHLDERQRRLVAAADAVEIGRGGVSMGYPAADRLLICADAGGSNGPRLRLWKVALQRFARESGLEGDRVPFFPPGTSKWNKIEHRLVSHITMNWRGRPLVSHDVIVNLIGATRTAFGPSS